MAKEHFIDLVEKAMTEVATTLVSGISPTDPHQHAKAVGKYEGLRKAIAIYRESQKREIDNE